MSEFLINTKRGRDAQRVVDHLIGEGYTPPLQTASVLTEYVRVEMGHIMVGLRLADGVALNRGPVYYGLVSYIAASNADRGYVDARLAYIEPAPTPSVTQPEPDEKQLMAKFFATSAHTVYANAKGARR